MQVSRFKARTVVLTVAATLAISVIAPVASYAGSEGNRNTAIGLAGAAAYLLINGKTLPGIAAAAGAGYAYNKYQQDRKAEQYRDSRYRVDRRYDCSRDNRNYRQTGSHWGSSYNRDRNWDRYNDTRRDCDRNDKRDKDYGRKTAVKGGRR